MPQRVPYQILCECLRDNRDSNPSIEKTISTVWLQCAVLLTHTQCGAVGRKRLGCTTLSTGSLAPATTKLSPCTMQESVKRPPLLQHLLLLLHPPPTHRYYTVPVPSTPTMRGIQYTQISGPLVVHIWSHLAWPAN